MNLEPQALTGAQMNTLMFYVVRQCVVAGMIARALLALVLLYFGVVTFVRFWGAAGGCDLLPRVDLLGLFCGRVLVAWAPALPESVSCPS